MKERAIRRTPEFGGTYAGIIAACLAAGLAGCATPSGPVGGAERSREAIVQERSQARWDSLVSNRLADSYKFYSPASRSVMSYEDFIRSIRVGFWKGATVERVECQAEDTCEAIVTIEYQYTGSRIRTPIRETWIRTEGTWWYVQKG